MTIDVCRLSIVDGICISDSGNISGSSVFFLCSRTLSIAITVYHSNTREFSCFDIVYMLAAAHVYCAIEGSHMWNKNTGRNTSAHSFLPSTRLTNIWCQGTKYRKRADSNCRRRLTTAIVNTEFQDECFKSNISVGVNACHFWDCEMINNIQSRWLQIRAQMVIRIVTG